MKVWRLAMAAGLALVLDQAAVMPFPPSVAHALPARAETLRIGVTVDAPSIVFSSSTGARLSANGKAFASIKPLEAWTARPSGDKLVFVSPAGASFGPIAGRIDCQSTGGNHQVPLSFSQDRWYRGSLTFINGAGSTVTAINQVSVDEYLFGVVPGEMPASWESEALKAQAIAARTYGLHNIGKEAKRGYDLCRTTHCQVYDGAAVETARSNDAVAATSGEVLMFKGKPIQAYFHASSGGYTDDAGEVWSESLPYIRAVADFDQASPRHVWYLTYTNAQVEAALAKIGVYVGRVQELAPVERTGVGRVKLMRAKGSGGQATFEAAKLRFAIGLHSTFFNVGRLSGAQAGTGGDGTFFQFAGRGWGHGLGMSQWGARGLAVKGFNYRQILAHFYPGSSLQSAFDTASGDIR